jgi:uncharacterized protein YgbK (DUF1537 family)
MNFSKLRLAECTYQKSRDINEEVNKYFSELRVEKEVSRSILESLYDWRKAIQEEHPYVEVYTSTDGQKKRRPGSSKKEKGKN